MRRKGGATLIEDLQKARWYLDRRIAVLKAREQTSDKSET